MSKKQEPVYNVRLTAETKQQLKDVAQRQGATAHSFARNAITAAIEKAQNQAK